MEAPAVGFRNRDYKIELELGTSLRFFLIYKLTKIELVALKEFV